MAGGNKKVSITLTNGVDNRTLDEFIGPVAAQGQSPKLKASTNTRLSARPGTCVRAPKVTSLSTSLVAGQRLYAAAPSASGRVTNFASPAAGAGWIVRDDGSDATGNGRPIGYSPTLHARVTQALSDDGWEHYGYAAMTYDSTSGLIYRAWVAATLGSSTIYVSAWSADGERVAFGGVGGAASSTLPWVGITAHGASGIRVWYYETGVGIRVGVVTISGAQLLVTGTATLLLPGQTAGIDLVSDGAGFAYLLHATVGSVTDATLRRIDVSSNATTHSVTLANSLNGGGKVSVQYAVVAGNARVLAVASKVTGATTTIALYDATLTVVGAAQTYARYGYTAAGFFDNGATRVAMVYVSAYNETFLSAYSTTNAAAATMGTVCLLLNLAAWDAPSAYDTYHWDVVQSQAVQWAPSGTTQQYPLFFMGRALGSSAYRLGEANYLDDPCHYVVLSTTGGTLDPVIARYGVVRGELAPAQTWLEPTFSSRQAVVVGDSLHVAWKRSGTLSYANSRLLTIDLVPSPLPIAHDKDGASLQAGALPMQWDAYRAGPIGAPLYGPKIYVTETAGAFAAGVYRFCVVHEWVDRSGCRHRSRPSNVFTVTLSGAEVATVYGTNIGRPFFYETSAILYMSVANGTSLHEKTRFALHSTSGGHWSYPVNSGVTGSEPQIYSTGSNGEERTPQPPPPARDIAIVGPRAWVIDAEEPSRLAPSKLRVAGVGYEWDPNLAVSLPSEAGDGYAVREWSGFTVVLCDGGVYQITGDGPSNAIGDSGAFSPPIKISDIGCNNTCSVVRFPGGIIWQYRNRFAMMSAAGIGYIEDFECKYDVSQAFCFPRHDEVLFFSSSVAEVRVFNYARKAWTVWDSQVLPAAPTLAAILPWDRDTILFYVQSSGTLYRMESELVSTCTSMVWETDWILPTGDFHDHVILQHVVFNGLIVGPHSLTIEVYFDYQTTLQTGNSKTWTSANLDSFDVGGRYSVRLEPKERSGRAFKIKVYDTVDVAEVTRDGVAPRSLTLTYSTEQSETLLYEDAFLQGSSA